MAEMTDNDLTDNILTPDEDEQIRRRYPHTHQYFRKVERARRLAESFFIEVAGYGPNSYLDDDMPSHLAPLCKQIEQLHDDVASLKQKVVSLKRELDLLHELSTHDFLDRYRTTLLQLRAALQQAPRAQREIYHLGDLSQYWDYYESWYTQTRAKALGMPLPAATSEPRGQQLSYYLVKVLELRPSFDPTWDIETDEDYIERSLKLRRVPLQKSAYRALAFDHETKICGCSRCGVLVDQLHLVDLAGRPVCEMEECSYCGKSAVTCGHCQYAQEEDVEQSEEGKAEHDEGAVAEDDGDIFVDDDPF